MKKLALVMVSILATASGAHAQWSQVHEQFYLPAEHNWEFRKRYAVADRLFNAFDYGHAILYEVLYSKPSAPVSRLEEKEYDFITRQVLPNPPRLIDEDPEEDECDGETDPLPVEERYDGLLVVER